MEKKPTQKKTVKKSAPKKAAVKAVKKTKAPQTKGALSAQIYDGKGKSTGTISLPERVFGAAWKAGLVHQVVLGMQANARGGKGRAHTKDRSEVRGGGRKPWRQKGTGQARHGSIRSPIWIGGGITHGPRADKNYDKRIPKGMRVAALYSALSRKLADGEIIFVDSLSFDVPKTKEARTMLSGLASVSGFEKLATKKQNAALILLSGNNVAAKKSFQNIGSVSVEEVRNVNVVDALGSTYLVIENPAEAIKILEAKIK